MIVRSNTAKSTASPQPGGQSAQLAQSGDVGIVVLPPGPSVELPLVAGGQQIGVLNPPIGVVLSALNQDALTILPQDALNVVPFLVGQPPNVLGGNEAQVFFSSEDAAFNQGVTYSFPPLFGSPQGNRNLDGQTDSVVKRGPVDLGLPPVTIGQVVFSTLTDIDKATLNIKTSKLVVNTTAAPITYIEYLTDKNNNILYTSPGALVPANSSIIVKTDGMAAIQGNSVILGGLSYNDSLPTSTEVVLVPSSQIVPPSSVTTVKVRGVGDSDGLIVRNIIIQTDTPCDCQ